MSEDNNTVLPKLKPLNKTKQSLPKLKPLEQSSNGAHPYARNEPNRVETARRRRQDDTNFFEDAGTEIYRQIGGGVRDAAQGAYETSTEISKQVGNMLGYEVQDAKQLPEVPEPEGTVGKIGRQVVQHGTGMIPANRALKTLGVANSGARAAGSSALSAGTVFGKDDETGADILQAADLDTILTRGLETNEDDTLFERKLKHMGEDLILSGVGEVGIKAIKGALGQGKRNTIETASEVSSGTAKRDTTLGVSNNLENNLQSRVDKIVNPKDYGPKPLDKEAGENALNNLDPEEAENILNRSAQEEVNKAAFDLIKTLDQSKYKEQIKELQKQAAQGKTDRIRISDVIADAIGNADIDTADFRRIREKYKLTPEDTASLYRQSIGRAASQLGEQGAARKKFDNMLRETAKDMSKEERLRFLKANQGISAQEQVRGWWSRLDNSRRGIMVTQFSTAMRNFQTQVANVTTGTIVRGLDNAMGVATGKKPINTDLVTDTFMDLTSLLARRNKDRVEEVLSFNPRQYDTLFNRYDADAVAHMEMNGKTEKAWKKVEDGVLALNVLNIMQEHWFRRAITASQLERTLKQNTGKGLDQWIKEGRAHEIPLKYVDEAVTEAMRKTWAKNPEKGMGEGKWFVDAVHGSKIGTLFVPFPRFLANSVKWQIDHSPLSVYKFGSKKQRQRMAEGDFEEVAKMGVGLGFFGAALSIRNSDYAGDEWYEINLGNGNTLDTRSYAPFSAYLFFADLVDRGMKGTLTKANLTGKKILEVVGGLQHSQAVDTFEDTMEFFRSGGSVEDFEKILRGSADVAGNWISTFAIPLTQLKDIYVEYMEHDGARIRDPALGEWWQHLSEPLLRRIPGGSKLSQDLPYAYQPTESDPIAKRYPVFRQLTGATLKKKQNPAASELTRLGFGYSEILPQTGNRVYDYWRTYYMGPAIEDHVVPMVERESYQNKSNAEKAELLRQKLQIARRKASMLADRKVPEESMKVKQNQRGTRRNEFWESQGGTDPRRMFDD